jgi:pyruvate carboxylase
MASWRGGKMIPEMSFDEKNEILFLKFVEEWTEKDIPEMFSRIRMFLEGKKKKNILGDVSEAPAQSYSRQMRNMVGEEVVDLKLDKVAILGANPVLRMMAKVLLAVIGNKWSAETRFFGSKAEALAWIKGEK